MADSAYSRPEIYEIAFSFRDYKKAVDFVIEAAKLAGLDRIESMVELGAGPGQCCLEFARRDIKTFGVDLCPEMVSYGNQKASIDNLNCTFIEGDMRRFRLAQKVDLACCMMATVHLLLTNRDLASHLDAVADNLNDNGIYLMELSHPRDIFTQEKSAGNVWEIERDGVKVSTDWGSDAKIDPITEISDIMVRYKIEKDGVTETIEGRDPYRLISMGLMRALIQANGRFAIAGLYGDLNVDQPLDNDKKSWRMIFVLKKM